MNSLILLTEISEKLILFILICLSIWSISIIIDRRKRLSEELDQDLFKKLIHSLEEKKISNLEANIQIKNIFISQGIKVILENQETSETIDRALASFIKRQRSDLEKGLSVLATLGANAPFLGLFGTVLGIIRSFAYLGSQTGSAAVMSGVSQALYATAMGLFVAIPAVIAFNIYTHRVKTILSWTESLRDLFIAKKNKGHH